MTVYKKERKERQKDEKRDRKTKVRELVCNVYIVRCVVRRETESDRKSVCRRVRETETEQEKRSVRY